MPPLSRFAVRASVVYLVVGFGLGALRLAEKGMATHTGAARLVGAHVEILLLGWLAQLVLGVAFWILPRFLQGPPRGREAPAWTAVLLLNAGVALAALDGLLPWSSIPAVGRWLECAAALAFTAHAWPRIRATVT